MHVCNTKTAPNVAFNENKLVLLCNVVTGRSSIMYRPRLLNSHFYCSFGCIICANPLLFTGIKLRLIISCKFGLVVHESMGD